MDILILFLLVLAVVFYFLPTVIASTRNTGHRGAIFWVNLLFGWTVLGWIAALIWAVVEKELPPEEKPTTQADQILEQARRPDVEAAHKRAAEIVEQAQGRKRSWWSR